MTSFYLNDLWSLMEFMISATHCLSTSAVLWASFFVLPDTYCLIIWECCPPFSIRRVLGNYVLSRMTFAQTVFKQKFGRKMEVSLCCLMYQRERTERTTWLINANCKGEVGVNIHTIHLSYWLNVCPRRVNGPFRKFSSSSQCVRCSLIL